MLGNFSFGDYFKKEAIAYAWEFLTRDMGLAKDRLKVTIFKGESGVPRDAEAHGFWLAHVPADRILELGAKDNFWAMGDTGPCGPCSEIHFFQGDSLPCPEVDAGRKCLGVECECDRWLEVWNLVFMQYDRDAAGTLNPLPAPCIDTGMGLERVTSVVQGKLTNYDTDLFQPLIQAIAKKAGVTYGADEDKDVSLRVVADHLRATTFLIGDGVMPGNEGRGYVLRKIMRRALRHGRKLGLEGAFLNELTGVVVERMAGAYPELRSQAPSIARVVRAEEERFGSTLKQAMAEFEKVVEKLGKAGGATTIPGRGRIPSLRHLRPAPRLPRGAGAGRVAAGGPGRLRARARGPARPRAPGGQDGRGHRRSAVHGAAGEGQDRVRRLRGPRPRRGDRPRRPPRRPARHPPRRGPGRADRPRPHAVLRRVRRPGRATTASSRPRARRRRSSTATCPCPACTSTT